MDSTIYSSEITPAEKKFGFELIEINSGYPDIISGDFRKTSIAAYRYDKSDFLFKRSDGKYKHMRYGYRLAEKDFPILEWFPMGEESYDNFEIKHGELIAHSTEFESIIGAEF